MGAHKRTMAPVAPVGSLPQSSNSSRSASSSPIMLALKTGPLQLDSPAYAVVPCRLATTHTRFRASKVTLSLILALLLAYLSRPRRLPVAHVPDKRGLFLWLPLSPTASLTMPALLLCPRTLKSPFLPHPQLSFSPLLLLSHTLDCFPLSPFV